MRAFDLSGRVAVVSGAGSPTGIGLAVARQLGEMGARVALGGTTARVADRARELRASGIESIAVIGDLTEPAAAEGLIQAALQQWNRIDVVVNNAGMVSAAEPDFQSGGLADTDLDTWHRSLGRNLDTAFLLTRAAMPQLISGGWGRIVMVSSVTGPVMAMKEDVAYATAKAGMLGLCRALAVDLAPVGVTVNAVAPGWVATGSQTQEEHRQGLTTPMGRSGGGGLVLLTGCVLCHRPMPHR